MIDGWTECKLGELFEFKNGLNAEKAAYGDGTPFVNVMDVFGNDTLTADLIRGKMKTSAKQESEYSVKHGDVLFNRTSETFDEVAMSAVYLDCTPAVFGGFVIRARPTKKNLDPHFCAYFFQSNSFRKELISRGQGAVRANIGQKDLATVPALVPPVPEQRRIAEILSTWDRAIATTEKLIANSEAQKKALMQRLLTGKKRLPGFSGAWEHHAFGRFAHTVRNKVDPRSLRDDVPGIELEHIEAESGRLLGTCQANAQVSLKTPFTRKNVLYGKLRPYLRKFFKPDFDGVCSTEIWALAAKPDLCTPEFLHLLVQSPTFAGAVDVSSGSKMPRADWGIVAVTIFAIPSVKEQTAIAGILRDADRAIEVHESQLTALRQEKSALMQQLLTGKRRVKLPEKIHA